MNVPVHGLPTGTRAAQSLERARLRISGLLVLLDALAILLSFAVAGWLYLGDPLAEQATRNGGLLIPLYFVLGMHNGFYRSESISDLRKAVFLCCYGLLLSTLVLLFINFYLKSSDTFSRVVFTLGFVLSLGSIVSVRWIVRHWAKRIFGPTLYNTLIIHAGGPPITREYAAYVNAQEQGLSCDLNDPQNLHRLGCYMENMDRVIVSCPQEDRDMWAPMLRAVGVEGEFVSTDLWKIGAIEIRNEAGFTSILVSSRPLSIGARFLKRAMDLILSSLALIVFSPVFLAVSMLIKLEDGGPVLFKQMRMGANNRFFWIYKFRSMYVDGCDATGSRSTSKDDDRTTRIGRFIRRTSLDELPQLLNVCKGEMSLVGPRPHALGSQAGERLFWEIDARYWSRHALKPGLTGLAQVRGYRGATYSEEALINRLQADLEYISEWSIWLDISILCRTFSVLYHDNAY